jgi:hypothetical protein
MALRECDLKVACISVLQGETPDETGCFTNRSLPERAELVTALCEASGTT